MPSNQINPNNYNIDNFDSGILGPITDNNFRNFLLGHNLKDINPAITTALGSSISNDKGVEYDVSESTFNVVDVPDLQTVAVTASLYNNLTTPLPDGIAKNPTETELSAWHPDYSFIFSQGFPSQGTSYGVPQVFKLGFAGNVEEWVNEGGYTSTVHEIRDLKMFARENNKYGPAEIIAYNDPDNPGINTGFIQYNDKIQLDFRETYLNRTLGVGGIPFSTLSSGINYKPDGQNISELDSIARKRRGVELKNRIKLNFVDNTVGAINTSPFGLLAGGNLIERNYTITVPKTGLGKVAEFTAKLAGFNLPTSIIPQDAFGGYGVDSKDVDITNALLDHTGGGQKSLLYDALYINKYGPNLEGSNNPISNATVKKNLFGAGQPPSTINYLTPLPDVPANPRIPSVIEDINNKIKSALHSNKTPQKPDASADGSPDSILTDGASGFDTLSSDRKHILSNGSPAQFRAENPIGTEMPAGDIPENNKPLDNGMYWGQGLSTFKKKGILKYTQDLVNKTTNDGKSGSRYIGAINSNFNYKGDKHDVYSNGNTTLEVLSSTPTGQAEFGSYCRSWSVRRPYKDFGHLIRSEKNWWRNVDERGLTKNMTLTETGIPKIAWDSTDNTNYKATLPTRAQQLQKENLDNATNLTAIKGMLVPYMLSIENLAWVDAPQYNYLPNSEKGPNRGRIMWFPPYNLDFNDNTSVSWDATTMVGRGEPIYTYNHTERSGNLSFSIVVDHPAVLNQIKKDFETNALTDDFVHSFFGGCADLKSKFKDFLPEEIKVPTEKLKLEFCKDCPPIKVDPPKEPPINNINIFFQNARTDEKCPANKGCIAVNTTQLGRSVFLIDLANPNGYEVGMLNCSGSVSGNTRAGLNEGKEDDLNNLAKFLVTSDGKNYTIKINGYCSGTASSGYNEKLGNDRALATRDYLLTKMQDYELNQGGPPKLEGTDKTYPSEIVIQNSKDRWVMTSDGESGAPPDTQDEDWKVEAAIDPCSANGKNENSLNSRQARKVTIKLEKNPVLQSNLLNEVKSEENKSIIEKNKEAQQLADAKKQIAKLFINESDYFMEMKHKDPFIYNSMKDRLDNFHPAFHAITPEGFNSRLTFLQQCTRQGPQLMDPTSPQNMVFGRPPVCVLRIGDFYHTKIIIDSINFTYDPLIWDLNPEGIGVQPMIVKVDLSFKFIGGSSLGGPIKQLQNAVSYNFFANTGVYNPAQKINNALESKRSFIYGAFNSPEDADKIYSEIQKEINKEVQDATNNNIAKAENTPEEKKTVEEKSPVSTTQSTVPVKPPTPPANTVGPKLVVIGIPFQAGNPNSSSEQFYIRQNSLKIPQYLGIKVSDPNGYKPGSTLTFTKNGVLVPYGGSGGQAIIIDNLPNGPLKMNLEYLSKTGDITMLTLDITI
jgi:hypothetical protein